MNKHLYEKTMMLLAEKVSQQSKDAKLKVGCVICTTDFRQITTGYNGNEVGGSNERDSMEPGQSNSIHAEINNLIFNNQPSYINQYMFVTHAPCIVCARAIVNKGNIKKVYFKNHYNNNGLHILKERGIEVEKIND